LVNVRVGTCVGDSASAVEDRVCLWVVAVLHRDNHSWITAYVVRFPPSLSGVEQQLFTLDVHPNHCEFGLALSVERHNVTVRLILEHRPQRLRNLDLHRLTPLLCFVPLLSSKISALINSLWLGRLLGLFLLSHQLVPPLLAQPLHAMRDSFRNEKFNDRWESKLQLSIVRRATPGFLTSRMRNRALPSIMQS